MRAQKSAKNIIVALISNALNIVLGKQEWQGQ